MTEKRLHNFVLTEGCLLLIFGFFVLLAPKISDLSFGLVLYLSYIILGGYLLIMVFITKKFFGFNPAKILSGLALLSAGIALVFGEYISAMVIISLIGAYFVFSSMHFFYFAVKVEGVLKPLKLVYMLSPLQALFGLIVMITISPAAIWFAGILTGINFILSGIVLIDMYTASKNNMM